MLQARDDLLTVFMGVGGVLVLASLIGWTLRLRFSPEGGNAAIDNLNDRIRAWWIMVIALALAFLGGRMGVMLLFALCSFAALREFMTLTNATRADHWSLVGVFFIVLPGQYYLVWAELYGIFAVFIPVYVFLLLPIMSALRGESRNFLIRVAEMQWALMICVFCASHVPALLNLTIPGYEGRNLLLIAFLVIVVQMSDVLQYIWGKLIGRHKIAPSLSPSKTIEGFLGGAGSATLLAAGLWWMTPFNPWQAGLMGAIITLFGFLGGLVMSAIKRDRGVKDWGHAIAGHGGFIDRLDSVVFSAPIFFHLTRYFWSLT
ncbi:phosphatidate cytidylyltransferase [Paracoccus saliphilus]|uniref:Phosphatidate cytidylyltransferase n=1 Tax=Paracoccus saliphilus TaxID=405559 RepID=A0AA45W3N9_9RHOB|nr:phosphatidate cytidylyltransferase [Paracoccus saliphilus]WCR02523.1 phosphatidate cytidylyltransferase [Paracoccus saliphilus]SIS76862.1 phosphatidate cytidylyltransferase [Paracoccus saliphilus]